jgi:hypothetical protein
MPERAHSELHHPPRRRQSKAARAPSRSEEQRLLNLQRSAGNRAVAAIVDGAVQRVEVKGDPYSETLYDQAGTAGKAGSKKYSLTPNFVLDRKGDTGLTVKVRVKFMHQLRGAEKKLIGSPTEIPTNDPDAARLGPEPGQRSRSSRGTGTSRCSVWSATSSPTTPPSGSR